MTKEGKRNSICSTQTQATQHRVKLTHLPTVLSDTETCCCEPLLFKVFCTTPSWLITGKRTVQLNRLIWEISLAAIATEKI